MCLLSTRDDYGAVLAAGTLARHRSLDPSRIYHTDVTSMTIVTHLINKGLRHYLIVLHRLHELQVVTFNLVVGVTIALVDIDVGDRVWICEYG